MDIVEEIRNGMKIKKGENSFARDYGAQLSLSNEMRSKKTSSAIIEKINGLHRMKKTKLVAKVIQLERQLHVYSSCGFVSVSDVKDLAERKSEEENRKLRESLDQLEEHNQFLKSRITMIEKLLKEKETKPEEGSDKSSSSSLSTVINISPQSSFSDWTKSLNRSIPEMEAKNSTLDCSSPLHVSSELEVERKCTQEQEKNSSSMLKKSFQKFSNILSRQNSKTQHKVVHDDKPSVTKAFSGEEDNTNPFVEDEKIGQSSNPFIEDEKEEQNTNPFFEAEKEEYSTNPFFEDEKAEPIYTELIKKDKVNIDENENEVINSFPDLNSNILEKLVQDYDKQKQMPTTSLTNQFWTEVETHILEKIVDNSQKKTNGDLQNEKEEPTDLEDKTVLKDNNENEMHLPTKQEFVKKRLCQSTSLDPSQDKESEKYETSSIKSEPATEFRKRLLCQTVSLDGGEIILQTDSGLRTSHLGVRTQAFKLNLFSIQVPSASQVWKTFTI